MTIAFDPELPAVVADSGHCGWSHRDAETWLRQSSHRIFHRLWRVSCARRFESVRYTYRSASAVPTWCASMYHTRRRHSRGSWATVSPLIS